MKARTDTHRPSVLDPAEYTMVGSFDAHHEDGYEEIEPGFENHEYSGDHAYTGRCGHCGHSIRYGVIFHHEPSDTLIAVGLTCANTLGLKSLSEKEIKATAEYHRILKAIAAWRAERPENDEAAEFLFRTQEIEGEYRDAMARWNDEGCVGPAPRAPRHNEFIYDVARKLRRYGSLSEKQVAAVLKNKASAAKFEAMRAADEAKLAEAPALEAGRQPIEGTVISIKWVDGFNTDFRGRPIEEKKMLVKLDNGNRVYGSVPSAIYEADKGDRVRFSADVQPKEEHFGFYKRPTKPELLNTEEGA